MPREDTNHIEQAGQDSFLDVTTNIVGVLIILVMVVGMRAQNPIVKASVPTVAELESLSKQAANIEYDVRRMGAEMASLDDEAETKNKVRESLATMIAAAQKELGDQRAKLDASKQENFDLQRALDTAREEIQRETTELNDLKSRKAPTIRVNHYPTPIGRKLPYYVHFQLLRGKISYVPDNDLGGDAIDEATHSGLGIISSVEKTGVVGPRNGFENQYTIRYDHTRTGDLLSYEFLISSVDSDQGEDAQHALEPQSEFLRQIHMHSPQNTAVVFWVYPDSIDLYYRLKEELHKMDYGVSLFPVEIGKPMRFGTNGVRPVAQ